MQLFALSIEKTLISSVWVTQILSPMLTVILTTDFITYANTNAIADFIINANTNVGLMEKKCNNSHWVLQKSTQAKPCLFGVDSNKRNFSLIVFHIFHS